MTNELTSETVARLRMHSLLLGAKRPKIVKAIAQWFGAMQSQDLASGKWSFGVRLALGTDWYASQLGVTCIGPNAGKEQTFVLLADWAKKQRRLPKDEALATLALRYFRSHGPATQQDFVGWTGLSVSEAKQGISMVVGQLAACNNRGKTLWMPKSLPEEVADSSFGEASRVQVLPGFDEYLLGIKDRAVAVPAAHRHKIIPGNSGVFRPTMVVDGVVVGTWKRIVKKKSVALQPLPFTVLKCPMRSEFEEAFAGYAHFLGLEPEISWT
jgi:hypothetical protein